MQGIFNFSAGPAMLPKQVLTQIKEELYDWNGLGVSVMEISHRSNDFIQLLQETKQNFRSILNIPLNYTILFCHGGARAQFSAIPMNLLDNYSEVADYINTGYWGYNAAIEAKKYCKVNIIGVRDAHENNFVYKTQPMCRWNISKNSAYIHYCPNETIEGISIHEAPNFIDKIVVADCSSTLLSRPINISRFGIIYAAAQKNIGISGVTVLIIRKDLIQRSYNKKVPSILNYQILEKNDSMFNTPTTISWYISNLMLKWIQRQGGLEIIAKRNQEKAMLLYHAIDVIDLYYNNIDLSNRSYMNVPFFLKKKELNHLFLKKSLDFGLFGLQGHKITGGIRASLYNAMTLEGVEELVKFMRFFAKKYG